MILCYKLVLESFKVKTDGNGAAVNCPPSAQPSRIHISLLVGLGYLFYHQIQMAILLDHGAGGGDGT